MPNKKVNEMFALASQILGGRRVTVLCEDGESRMARIPGKMRRRQWVREGDLIIVWPWDFQDSKADVKHRYTKTQAMYLSRKGVLPDDVDMFGMGASVDDDGEHDDLFATGPVSEDTSEEVEDDLFADDGGDDLFADDGEDDLFAGDDGEAAADAPVEEASAEAVAEPTEEYDVVEEEPGGADDDDDDIDALFA
ncbi:MAG: translation initiation factor eIF-1A [Euryarchaeota archaeon]|nr:translation initiation factor eIF-1A [Euryarchaeota archaeon]